MTNKNDLSTHDPSWEGARMTAGNLKNMRDHAESPVNTSISKNELENGDRPFIKEVAQGSRILPELLTMVQAATLLGCHVATIRRQCAAGKYSGATKQTINGGEGWLIPITSLPKAAQKAYAKQTAVALIEKTGVKDVPLLAPAHAIADAEYGQLWERYERKDSNFKRMAEDSLTILLDYLAVKETGVSVGFAEESIKASHGVARSTIRRYLDYTKSHPRQHWLPLLCPNYHGGRGRAEFTQAAYDFILALKIKSPSSNLRVLIRAAIKEGADKGWVLPSEDTIAKRLKEEPAYLFSGKAALERSFPTIERDYPSLDLHQCWESDGRKVDVFCKWPDGTVNRPFVIAIREVRTRRLLSIRVCHAPDAEAVMGVYGMALMISQAVPRYFKLDNGREYANKTFTGQQKTRYRFKYATDEAQGILTAMGVEAKWSKPGQGRDKPIESWWNVVANNCDKAPEFAGAYCGRNVLSKPEDFDKKKAVSVEAYAAKLMEVLRLNDAEPHRGHGMSGRSSKDIYEELAAITVTRKPTASEIRRCKMGVVSLSLDKKDCSFRFKMKGYDMPMKYWAEELADLPVSERDGKFNVHYDWGEPNSPVAVYRGDAFICDAKPQGRIDFLEAPDGEKVRNHMEKKGEFIKQKTRVINAAKAKGTVALPDISGSLILPPMVAPNPLLVIAPSSKVHTVAAPVSPLQPVEGSKNEFVSTKTGLLYKRKDLECIDKMAEEQRNAEARDARLEELRLKKLEKDLANLKAG